MENKTCLNYLYCPYLSQNGFILVNTPDYKKQLSRNLSVSVENEEPDFLYKVKTYTSQHLCEVEIFVSMRMPKLTVDFSVFLSRMSITKP